MTPRNFWAFVGMSALIFALAFGAVGCGGSSGGDVHIDRQSGGGTESEDQQSGEGTVSFTGHHILFGASGRTDSEMSELLPHIRNLITDTLDISKIASLDTDGIIVSSADIIFLEDASTIKADDIDTVYPIRYAFYNRHVTIAAIYPDAEDVKALGNILGLTLVDPSNESNDKHFEIIAASMRYASGDTLPQTFVYLDKCSVNRVHNSALYTVSKDPVVINVDPASWDSYFGDDDEATTPTADELAALSRDYEAHAEERLKERVQKLIDWSKGIDNEMNILRSSIIEDASRLAFTVADQTGGVASEITKFVGGVQTQFSDTSYHSCFYDYDYARRHGSQAGDWNSWTDYSGCGDYSTLRDHWNGFKPGLDISVTLTSYSVHSFADHNDYYLITTTATIQPHDTLQVRAEYGDRTGDEVKGSGAYHYAVIMGCNKKLECYHWPNDLGTELVKLTPGETVNNNQSFSDTDGWSMGGGVSGGGNYGKGTTKDSETGGGGQAEGSFNYTVTHNASHTWQTTDYSITPKRSTATSYPPLGRPVPGWVLDVSAPYYSGGQGWQISAAAKTAVTLDAEAIWRVQPDKIDNAGFTAQAHWSEGFYAAHDMGGDKVSDANCVINHDTGYSGVNLAKPLKTGIGDTTTHGTKEGKTYYAKIFTESDWTAESNADWLQLTSTSGGVSNGADFGYTATANETNQDRTGIITVKSGNDTVTLTFVQSRY